MNTASAPARSQFDEPESGVLLLLSELQPLTASESVRLTMVAATIDPAMRNMSPPEMLFRKEAVRASVDFKVAKFCEKFRKIPSVTLLSVSARDCRRGKVFALVPLRAESPISGIGSKKSIVSIVTPNAARRFLVWSSMIGVTSRLGSRRTPLRRWRPTAATEPRFLARLLRRPRLRLRRARPRPRRCPPHRSRRCPPRRPSI